MGAGMSKEWNDLQPTLLKDNAELDMEFRIDLFRNREPMDPRLVTEYLLRPLRAFSVMLKRLRSLTEIVGSSSAVSQEVGIVATSIDTCFIASDKYMASAVSCRSVTVEGTGAASRGVVKVLEDSTFVVSENWVMLSPSDVGCVDTDS
jgi:hypothetical protein